MPDRVVRLNSSVMKATIINYDKDNELVEPPSSITHLLVPNTKPLSAREQARRKILSDMEEEEKKRKEGESRCVIS